MSEIKKWNIADFGVYPGAEPKICTDGICRALKEASDEEGLVEIIFPKGDYKIGIEDKFSVFAISGSGIKDVKLSGCGSRLLVTSPFNGVFTFSESENITIDGFEVKYKSAPWTQGKIIDVDTLNGTLIYESDSDFDLFSDPRFEKFGGIHGNFGAIMDKDNPIMMKSVAPEEIFVKAAEKISDRTYRITVTEPQHVQNGRIEKNDKMVCTNRGKSGAVFGFYRSRNITVSNMITHECGDCLFVAAYIEGDIVIKNYRSEIDGHAYIVSNADGVHIQGLRGRLFMENCCFEGLLDDGLNIYQFPAAVKEKVSDHELKIHQAEGNIPYVGDTVMFYDHLTGEKKLTARVEDVTGIDTETNTCLLRLDCDCSDIITGENFLESDEMFIRESMASGTVIKNNIFRISRRYGLLLKTVDTVVEGNTFYDLGGDAVNFTADTIGNDEREGPYAENVVLRNNSINNVCYMNTRKNQTKWASGGAIGLYRYNKDIMIEGNTFENMNSAKLAFFAKGIFMK